MAKKNDAPEKNRAEYSCFWCGHHGECQNPKCVMNNMACDGSRSCGSYIHYSTVNKSDKGCKPKKWHKVKTMFDTYLPNARYY